MSDSEYSYSSSVDESSWEDVEDIEEDRPRLALGLGDALDILSRCLVQRAAFWQEVAGQVDAYAKRAKQAKKRST